MSDSREKLIVTSALPYANGPIHFGHITGAYLDADIFVRYKKMCDADILYICGTDDHGVAITISAEASDRSPEEHVKINHKLIKSIFDKMNIEFTYFSQTSNPTNHEMSRHFFTKLDENGLIEQKDTDQLYCKKCDRFLADRYVTGTCPHCGHEGARGDECGGCGQWLDALEIKSPTCKVCGETPEVKSTTNWYLKLKDREQWLKDWLESMEDPESDDQVPWKKLVVSEIKGYLSRGLENRAITRDLKWGVQLPEPYTQDGKVLYVWFDAPIGYVSFTKEYFQMMSEKDPDNYKPEMWKDYWRNPDESKLVHFIGKDNIVFHAMIFPIMMDGTNENYNLPYFVAGNAFLNLEGRQFSKSEGWYIDALEFFENYPVDSLRYYLCAEMPENSDTEFRWESYQTHHNSELVNIYANLVNRTLKFLASKLDGKVPPAGEPGENDTAVIEAIKTQAERVGSNLNNFMFRPALHEMLQLAREGNQYFDSEAPWKSLTEDPARCNHAIRMCLNLIKTLAVTSAPFLPDTAQRIWEMLGLEGSARDIPWDKAADDIFKDGAQLPEPEPLFQRLDKKQIAAEMEKLGGGKKQDKPKKQKGSSIPGVKKAVDIEDFGKVDLRVGRVLDAEPVQGSNKMLKLTVDIGLEKRQVIAGIAKFYSPEDMKDRLVILVANLEPKKLMGLESQGMVLAAGPSKNIHLLTVDGDIEPGTRVS